MGCPYPSVVDSPDRLWEVVTASRDVVSDFPVDHSWALM